MKALFARIVKNDKHRCQCGNVATGYVRLFPSLKGGYICDDCLKDILKRSIRDKEEVKNTD